MSAESRLEAQVRRKIEADVWARLPSTENFAKATEYVRTKQQSTSQIDMTTIQRANAAVAMLTSGEVRLAVKDQVRFERLTEIAAEYIIVMLEQGVELMRERGKDEADAEVERETPTPEAPE